MLVSVDFAASLAAVRSSARGISETIEQKGCHVCGRMAEMDECNGRWEVPACSMIYICTRRVEPALAPLHSHLGLGRF